MKKEATYAMPIRANSTLATNIPMVMAGQRPVVWSIADVDPQAGVTSQAPLQADLAALRAFGVHGCTAVAYDRADSLDAQLAVLAQESAPQAIKTGLLRSVDQVRVVARWVDRLRAQGRPVALVVDPVLGDASVAQACVQELLPRATLVTPHGAETARLGLHTGQPYRPGQASIVVIDADDSGASGLASDWLCSPQAAGWLSVPRPAVSQNPARDTFAATAAAALASGYCVADAVVLAKMAGATTLPWLQPQPGGQGTFAALSDPALGVYAVVDSADWVRRVLNAGIRTVQLRIKDPHDPTLAAQVQQSIANARATPGAQLFINDHWQLALQHGAYGVHLGQEDLDTVDLDALQAAGVRLGLSTHSYWEVARAWALRPSYIACGPIFATQSKDMPWIPQGLDNLRYWAGVLALPVVGIAGIDTSNVADVAATGVAGAAVISAITRAADPEAACRELVRRFG